MPQARDKERRVPLNLRNLRFRFSLVAALAALGPLCYKKIIVELLILKSEILRYVISY